MLMKANWSRIVVVDHTATTSRSATSGMVHDMTNNRSVLFLTIVVAFLLRKRVNTSMFKRTNLVTAKRLCCIMLRHFNMLTGLHF